MGARDNFSKTFVVARAHSCLPLFYWNSRLKAAKIIKKAKLKAENSKI